MPTPEHAPVSLPAQIPASAAAAAGLPAVKAAGTAKAARSETTSGILYGIGAYGLWGLLPLYFLLLQPAGAVEIVANRVVWSLLFCAVLIAVTRNWGQLATAFRDRTIFLPLVVAALLIAVNWLTYTYGITTNQAVEASLGYFINPLVSVLLGVFVLKETLRPLQWAAVGIGFAAVAVLTISYGKLPWIALALAFSFGLYGFVKKRVGPRLNAVTSLTVETVVLAPFAGATMLLLGLGGSATLGNHGAGHFWLLLSSGVITAVPLVFFGASASRLPLTTIGMLQYFAPLLQFIVALTVMHEAMTTARWIGFGIVWFALALLTVDMFRTARRNAAFRRQARATPAHTA